MKDLQSIVDETCGLPNSLNVWGRLEDSGYVEVSKQMFPEFWKSEGISKDAVAFWRKGMKLKVDEAGMPLPSRSVLTQHTLGPGCSSLFLCASDIWLKITQIAMVVTSHV